MGIFDGISGGQSGLANMSAEEQYRRIDAQKAAYHKTIINSIHAQYGQQAQKAFNPNESEPYMMPLSNLIALWRAKYGDKWIETHKIDEDFWRTAFNRLYANSLFEQCEDYARLKESA